jgi:hypothetical protein
MDVRFRTTRDPFSTRLVLGLIQGLLLYGLMEAGENHDWPATHAQLFSPLLLIGLLVPPVLIIGIGHLRSHRQLLWGMGLALVVAALGCHDAWRAVEPMFVAATPRPLTASLPSFQVTFFAAAFVFIGYALIVAGEATHRWFAPYEAYFESSWKLGLQLGLSLLFLGIFHLVLHIGEALFLLVGLTFLRDLLGKLWFNAPVSAMVFAIGLHITDARPDFVRGIRTLLLMLMSWLLPLLVLIVAGFLLRLFVTGLTPLWSTRYAAKLLLGVAMLDVAFINAAFRSGSATETIHPVLRVATRIACVMLLPVVVLASYALKLRVDQYGLTISRILVLACLLVAACYAIGYAWAALEPRGRLRRIAPTNVLTACVTLAVLVALFTPVADPARLAVDSQVDRLLAGRVKPDQFDFRFLRFSSAIYGRQALARLQSVTSGPNAEAIRTQSLQFARLPGTPGFIAPGLTMPDALTLSHNIIVRASGQTLPASFLSNDWQHATDRRWLLPACLTAAGNPCDAYLLDLMHDGKPNVFLIPPAAGMGTVFGQDATGRWRMLGRMTIAPDCVNARAALASGSYRAVTPSVPDVEINGQSIHIEPVATNTVCSR